MATQPDDARSGVEQELVGLLQAFTVEVDRFVEVFATGHGLHRTDLNAVAHIARATAAREPLTPGELAKLLSLSPSATTAALDRLVRAGHVERVHDDADRRRVLIRMRPAAHAVASAFFRPLGNRMREAMRDSSPEELAVIASFLRRAVASASAAADDALHDGP